MKIIPFMRNKGFWIMDAIKGGPVKAAYNDIKKIDEMDSDNPFIKEYQEQAWQTLKEKACSNTKAYANYVDYEFSQFPIISKQDIRSSQDDYISSEFEKEKLVQMSTSGSTGTPFVCYQNSGKKRKVNAEIIYYTEKVGYKLGENLSYIRTIVKQNKKSKLKQFVQNQTLIHCSYLNDSGIEEIIDQLRKHSQNGAVTLLAYGSTYTALKDYFIKNKITGLENCHISGAVSGSDMLFDETREVVSQVFGKVPVISRYSNEENGVLGQDEGMNNVFCINEANYIIEIVDDNDKPVDDGTVGRIVVTDLYNYAMPMIRYDTGDMGAIRTFDINGRKKRCIYNFSGRKVDVIYDSEGNALSPHTITNYMWEFTEIRQFQLIQKNQNQYLLKLNVDASFQREEALSQTLKNILGGMQLEIEYVDEIPVLSSGKRRYIINEWKK